MAKLFVNPDKDIVSLIPTMPTAVKINYIMLSTTYGCAEETGATEVIIFYCIVNLLYISSVRPYQQCITDRQSEKKNITVR